MPFVNPEQLSRAGASGRCDSHAKRLRTAFRVSRSLSLPFAGPGEIAGSGLGLVRARLPGSPTG